MFRSAVAVVAQLLRIGLLSGKPLDLPSSYVWLGIVGVASVAVDVAAGFRDTAVLALVGTATAQLGMLALCTWIALRVRGYPERFVQTTLALVGGTLWVSLATWPLGLFMPNDQAVAAPAWVVLVMLLLLAWLVGIVAHVLHQTLAVSLPVASVLGGVILLVSLLAPLPLLAPPA